MTAIPFIPEYGRCLSLNSPTKLLAGSSDYVAFIRKCHLVLRFLFTGLVAPSGVSSII